MDLYLIFGILMYTLHHLFISAVRSLYFLNIRVLVPKIWFRNASSLPKPIIIATLPSLYQTTKWKRVKSLYIFVSISWSHITSELNAFLELHFR
jgi:hypothetical protein